MNPTQYRHLDGHDRQTNLKTVAAIDARINERMSEARELARGDLTGDDVTRFDNLEAELDELRDWRETMARIEAAYANGSVHRESGDGALGGPNINLNRSPWEDIDRVAPHDLRARAASAIEATVVGDDNARQAATEAVQNATGTDVARWALVTSQPAYASAFTKLMNDPQRGHLMFTPEEAGAVQTVMRWEAERAMSEGTTTAGGFMVPTHLDPAILLSNSGRVNPIRRLARKVQITTKAWNGVSSAGITVSFATEFAVATDNSPTLAQPSITAHKAHGWVPASFEVIEDVTSLGEQVADLFRDGVDEAEANAFATGTGTNEPVGIVTALVGGTRVTTMATNSAIGVPDLEKIQRHSTARARQAGASWLMNLSYLQAVRNLGDDALSAQTVNLAEGSPGRILGDNAYEVSAMTSALNQTTNNAIVYGDVSAYTIVDRLGAMIEYVPVVFDPTTGRPNGSRGWYLHFRVGGDVTVDEKLVLGVNQNTAFI